MWHTDLPLAQHSEMVHCWKNICLWSVGIKCYHYFHIVAAVVVIRRQSSWAVQRTALLRENMAAEVEFSRRIAFCCPLGTSVYLWLLSLGLGLVSSLCLPVSLNGKTVLLQLGQIRSITPLLHVSVVCVLDIFSISGLECIPVTVCAFSTVCVLSFRSTILTR